MSQVTSVSPRATGPRRRRALAVLFALVIYGGIFTTMKLADRLVLFPQVGPLDASGAERRLIGEGQHAMEVWIARSRPHEEPQAYLLRFYGNADRAERWTASEARSYGRQSLELWGVNYPGFGGSSGPATLAGVARAGTQAVDAISAIAGAKPVFVIGTSIGTTARSTSPQTDPSLAACSRTLRLCARSSSATTAGGTCGCSPMRWPPSTAALENRLAQDGCGLRRGSNQAADVVLRGAERVSDALDVIRTLWTRRERR